MIIYCLGKNDKEAVSIGSLLWLPWMRKLSDYNEDEDALLAICRPHDMSKKARFNSYIEEMKSHGPVKYVLECDLPKGCKKRVGFWENNGWK